MAYGDMVIADMWPRVATLWLTQSVTCIAAINCACLVYDGRLVIDASFHTNDVSVHAAGPLTKYQRRYYTELTHADFSSKEIGMEVSSNSSDLWCCVEYVLIL